MSELDRMIFVYNIIKIRFIVVLLKKKCPKNRKSPFGVWAVANCCPKNRKRPLGVWAVANCPHVLTILYY